MSKINHIAIIMDGNGRWGLKKYNSRKLGHKQGVKTVEKIIQATINHKIKHLTLYTFSTENWRRPKYEINFLFNMLGDYLNKNLDSLIKNNLKINIIGDISRFPINYVSKNEILSSFKKILRKKLKPSIKSIENNLFTKNIPDPEILIRTGDTKRLSNFLLWQISYSEIFFVRKLWPDFSKKDLDKIIKAYDKIKRKFGKI